MANVNLAKSFWKTIKSVSVKEVAKEARKPFAVAIVGQPEARERILLRLFPHMSEDDVLPQRSLIRTFDSTSVEDDFPQESGSFDMVIDAGGGRIDAPEGIRLYSVAEVGGWERLVERILDERPDLALSLARRFPGFRESVAERIVRDTSVANAEFAMISALPGIIPIIGPLLPAGAIGDLFMLTKNQAMMMYRLAAIYELPLDVSSRSRDLAPILAQAFGWRALAREIVGIVPGGVGLVARGSIAYAGTTAVGKAIHALYRTGKQPSRAQIREYYRQALASGKEIVRGIRSRLTSSGTRTLPYRRAIEPRRQETSPERPEESSV
jgi:uncharacterized protein (DUF697 family)